MKRDGLNFQVNDSVDGSESIFNPIVVAHIAVTKDITKVFRSTLPDKVTIVSSVIKKLVASKILSQDGYQSTKSRIRSRTASPQPDIQERRHVPLSQLCPGDIP
jgi:hypothetical protein